VGRHGKHSNTEADSVCRNAKAVAGRLWGRQERQTCRGRRHAGKGKLSGIVKQGGSGRQVGRLGHRQAEVDVGRQAESSRHAEVYSGREADAF
jgi:hypothetical protein